MASWRQACYAKQACPFNSVQSLPLQLRSEPALSLSNVASSELVERGRLWAAPNKAKQTQFPNLAAPRKHAGRREPLNSEAKKSAIRKSVSALKRCTYTLTRVFSLDSLACFGYDMHYENETRDLLVQFSRGINEQILSRDLASIRVQQKANPVSGHCELYRSVLTAHALLQAIVSRPTEGGFFYASDYLNI